MNKQSTGGIESLVSCLVSVPKKEEIFHHEAFLIAGSRLSRKLFGARIIRRTVYLTALIRLTNKIIESRHEKYQKTIFLFHHAESHRLMLMISKLIGRTTEMFVYVHQSPSNFPRRLIPSTLQAIQHSERTIFYSSQIEQEWKARYPTIDEAATTIVHNFVCENRIKKNEGIQKDQQSLVCLYLGRNVPWKRPHLAVEWAGSIAREDLPVKLIFAGIEPTSSEKILDQVDSIVDSNFLDLEFLGLVEDVGAIIQEADVLFVPADYSLTPEVIGIASLEALSLGLPVFVSTRTSTDYKMHGIYAIEDLISCSKEQSLLQIRTRFAPNGSQVEKWRDYNSRRRYEDDLLAAVCTRTDKG